MRPPCFSRHELSTAFIHSLGWSLVPQRGCRGAHYRHNRLVVQSLDTTQVSPRSRRRPRGCAGPGAGDTLTGLERARDHLWEGGRTLSRNQVSARPPPAQQGAESGGPPPLTLTGHGAGPAEASRPTRPHGRGPKAAGWRHPVPQGCLGSARRPPPHAGLCCSALPRTEPLGTLLQDSGGAALPNRRSEEVDPGPASGCTWNSSPALF